MNTATITRSDFSLAQCRDALANFDQATLRQAVVVMTSQDAERLENAGNHPEFGPAIFWVREWSKVECIKTRKEALNRLKVVQAHRLDRQAQIRNAVMGIFIAAGSAALAAHSMFSFTA